jgi:hypothetical protein
MILPCTYKRNLKYDTTQDVKKLLMALMDKMEKKHKNKNNKPHDQNSSKMVLMDKSEKQK